MLRLALPLVALTLGTACVGGAEVVYRLDAQFFVFPTGGTPPTLPDTSCGTTSIRERETDVEELLYDYDSPTARFTVMALPGLDALTVELRGREGVELDAFELAADAPVGTENTLAGTSGDRDFEGTFLTVDDCD